MAKETFDRSKPHLNVGTIGHVQMQQLLIRLIMHLKKKKEGLRSTLLT
jgi:translation elongation factor EF-Tu-like GTPase